MQEQARSRARTEGADPLTAPLDAQLPALNRLPQPDSTLDRCPSLRGSTSSWTHKLLAMGRASRRVPCREERPPCSLKFVRTEALASIVP